MDVVFRLTPRKTNLLPKRKLQSVVAFSKQIGTLHVCFVAFQKKALALDTSQLSLFEAQQRVDTWIKTVGVRYFSELTNLAQLVEEVGELARVLSRTYGDQSFKSNEQSLDVGDELADVLFVVICLANQTGVDLTDAFQNNLRKKTERDSTRHKENPKLQ